MHNYLGNLMPLILSLLMVLALLPGPLSAEISWNQDAVSHSRLPAPAITKTYVRLDVPHYRQDQGHTFVVMGFNDQEQVIYVRDPNLSR